MDGRLIRHRALLIAAWTILAVWTIPVAAQAPPVALITEIEGAVTIIRAKGVTVESAVWGDQLNRGDVVRTGDDAVANFAKLAERYPDAPLPHEILGNLYRDLGREDDAIAELQTAIRLEQRK